MGAGQLGRQPGGGNVGIALGRLQMLVAQQHLDVADVGAALQEMGRIGVA